MCIVRSWACARNTLLGTLLYWLSNIHVQWRLGITRSLGPGRFVCYVGYFAVSVADGQCETRQLIHWGRRELFVVSGVLLDQISLAAFMLILRRQNQRFETLIQNADSKRPSREYCSCFPREEDDFVSMHCALFEAIVRAQVNRKGVYMTSFKRGYM